MDLGLDEVMLWSSGFDVDIWGFGEMGDGKWTVGMGGGFDGISFPSILRRVINILYR